MTYLHCATLIALLVTAGCNYSVAESDRSQEHGYDVAAGASEYDLTEEERLSHEKAAISGDPVSAKHLAKYYSFIHNDTMQSVRWLRIAVNDGNPITAQNLAYDLHTLGGQENCAESLRILRAIRDLYPDPNFIDDSIRELESDFQSCVNHGRTSSGPPNNSFKPNPLRGSA